ncbi:hypothetical protein Btru_023634 [Bulinus truncatus]|nr:hypothetical protein Btru_023634 [Bulinus truncatus]
MSHRKSQKDRGEARLLTRYSTDQKFNINPGRHDRSTDMVRPNSLVDRLNTEMRGLYRRHHQLKKVMTEADTELIESQELIIRLLTHGSDQQVDFSRQVMGGKPEGRDTLTEATNHNFGSNSKDDVINCNSPMPNRNSTAANDVNFETPRATVNEIRNRPIELQSDFMDRLSASYVGRHFSDDRYFEDISDSEMQNAGSFFTSSPLATNTAALYTHRPNRTQNLSHRETRSPIFSDELNPEPDFSRLECRQADNQDQDTNQDVLFKWPEDRLRCGDLSEQSHDSTPHTNNDTIAQEIGENQDDSVPDIGDDTQVKEIDEEIGCTTQPKTKEENKDDFTTGINKDTQAKETKQEENEDNHTPATNCDTQVIGGSVNDTPPHGFDENEDNCTPFNTNHAIANESEGEDDTPPHGFDENEANCTPFNTNHALANESEGEDDTPPYGFDENEANCTPFNTNHALANESEGRDDTPTSDSGDDTLFLSIMVSVLSVFVYILYIYMFSPLLTQVLSRNYAF